MSPGTRRAGCGRRCSCCSSGSPSCWATAGAASPGINRRGGTNSQDSGSARTKGSGDPMHRPPVLLLAGALQLAAVALLAVPDEAEGGKPKGGQVPVTGATHPNLVSFDQMMNAFIKDHRVPGATLAVAKDGRLVYARGFGYADLDKRGAVQPNSL